MSDKQEVPGWAIGQTAEDFANIVKASLGDSDSGVVVVPCEDYTIPDHVAFGGGFEFEGESIPFTVLFGGALKHFHGLDATVFSAVPTGSEEGLPYSMGLQVMVTKPDEAV